MTKGAGASEWHSATGGSCGGRTTVRLRPSSAYLILSFKLFQEQISIPRPTL
jgi:hypothetical protein